MLTDVFRKRYEVARARRASPLTMVKLCDALVFVLCFGGRSIWLRVVHILRNQLRGVSNDYVSVILTFIQPCVYAIRGLRDALV